jgi:polar amino acid transport system permease protein
MVAGKGESAQNMLENFSFRTIVEYLPLFGQGLVATVWLSLISFAGALAIGVVVCALNLQPARFLRLPAKVYIDAVRATPLLAQLYFLYFGLPRLGVVLPEMLVGIIALSLNSGAYVAEIIRAGILSISKGVLEGSRCLGLTYMQAMRYVAIPMALRRMSPGLVSQLITLFKDTALCSVVSVQEVLFTARILAARDYQYFTLYTVAGFFYFAVGFPAAAATGYFRMAADKHWLTDVLTGAMTGTAVGFAVPWLHRTRPGATLLTLSPRPGGAVLSGRF